MVVPDALRACEDRNLLRLRKPKCNIVDVFVRGGRHFGHCKLETMVLLRWGKRFKHSHHKVCSNTNKALDSFMKVIESGFALNMVDAGLIYWKMERRRWKMMIKFYKILKLRNKIKNDNFIVINNNE